MSKTHRDNHKARMKRGAVAFEKKRKRRSGDPDRKKCSVCGTMTRRTVLVDNICPLCYKRMGIE